ncbi:molecular chaperone HtpG [Borrelia miyamotoi]|uniref:Chaperone protein HtpG n=1 Tax=Borrelia miyamotoi TaxID=47466 RepID=A0AAQ3AGX7_9SPIR|nr:molecular chaperone HtpG [Borrelia miyamotoi]AGT27516.1 heat shock protein Hsp90 [Borrelia miyamotoi LB-2001]AJA58697.1 molecular chaperone Hsp90 [Borrelia miyamotoi]AOW95775.1 molecular chaperone HtpG [Borrelia miyamotoi]QTL83664.1 molecular chaperone HtpG [Borrelia miyamotoi]WAZ85034.1 molecular chaperone HtpG [Borrelia miyamotoi]
MKKKFDTEVNDLLYLIIHSLYSHKEIFLRELISNASDAIDKLKFLSLTDEKFKNVKLDPRIEISFNEQTIKIKDNGIGMNKEDLINHLGTIAKSGTKEFINNLKKDEKKAASLIGQFGVGFYSAFIVANKVEVITKKALEEVAYIWFSDGKTGYEINKAEKDEIGTEITLYLNEEGTEYNNKWKIQEIIKKYSNHISYPIFIKYKEPLMKDGKQEGFEEKEEKLNETTAIWIKNKNEITDEEYNEFYKNITFDYENPLIHIHTKAEGSIEYTSLFYVPSKAPYNLYYPNPKPGVRLFINRIFITDSADSLLPNYLRFIKGIIDCQDLPLNVSREILQQNKILTKIKASSVKKILIELEKLSETNPAKFNEFSKEFGRCLKEGVYSDFDNRSKLISLIRFKSSHVDGFISLKEYKDRMPEKQKSIYYITGGKENILKINPIVSAYKERGYETLIMDDELDEAILNFITEYDGIKLKAINKNETSNELKDENFTHMEEEFKDILIKVKEILKNHVKDVSLSATLIKEPSAIIIDSTDPTYQMQKIMISMGQEVKETKPILELNPNNKIIQNLKNLDHENLEKISIILLEEAMITSGLPSKNPSQFISIINEMLEKSI